MSKHTSQANRNLPLYLTSFWDEQKERLYLTLRSSVWTIESWTWIFAPNLSSDKDGTVWGTWKFSCSVMKVIASLSACAKPTWDATYRELNPGGNVGVCHREASFCFFPGCTMLVPQERSVENKSALHQPWDWGAFLVRSQSWDKASAAGEMSIREGDGSLVEGLKGRDRVTAC